VWQVDYNVGDALWDWIFELDEAIKCDMLKFLKVSKFVSTFSLTFFPPILQKYYVVQIVKSRLKVSLKISICKFYSYVAFWKGLGHDLISWTHVMQ
jgi:hypothetical protein